MFRALTLYLIVWVPEKEQRSGSCASICREGERS